MKYTIVSINEDRADKKAAIKTAMHNHTEITDIPFVNGFDPAHLEWARNHWPGIEPEGWDLSPGEYGIWYSQLNCWWYAAQEGDLLVLEDDAIVSEEFDVVMGPLLTELPDDYDFMALFVPDNQLQDFRYRVNYDAGGAPMNAIDAGDPGYQYAIDGKRYVTRAYQGYSCVANLISQKGARKLIERLRVRHIYSTVDCFMFLEAHQGTVEAYAHHPSYQRPVTYDWNTQSIRVGT